MTDASVRNGIGRRAVLGGLAALPALTAVAAWRPGAALAATGGRITLGSMEVAVVSDGTLTLPTAMQLPEAPPSEAAALLGSGAAPPATITTQANVTLVRAGGELVLIDAGSGPNWQDSAGKLAANLEAAGIARDQVTRVVLTHGHADHLWGALDEFDEETFPNASYVISAAEWDFWTAEGTPSRVPAWLEGMARGSARILRRLEPRMERRRDGERVGPGLTYMAAGGHTPGHMAVLAEDGGARLVVGADTLTHPSVSFAKPGWAVGTDLDRDAATATRHRMLDMLATDRLPLIGFHLPLPGIGHVERKDLAYRLVTS